jgi:hypothetical protein
MRDEATPGSCASIHCRALPAANYSAGCPSLDEIGSAAKPVVDFRRGQ